MVPVANFEARDVNSTPLGPEIDDADIDFDVRDVDLGSERPVIHAGNVEVTPPGRDHTPVEHSVDVADIDVRADRGVIDVADVDHRPFVAKFDVSDVDFDVGDVDLGSEQPAIHAGDVEVTPPRRDHTPVEHSIDDADIDVRVERGVIDAADVDHRPFVAKFDVSDVDLDVGDVDLGSEQPAIHAGDVEVKPPGVITRPYREDFKGTPPARHRLSLICTSASALNHPHVISIYEIGEDDSLHYIAMELVEGKTLREHVGGGPLELDARSPFLRARWRISSFRPRSMRACSMKESPDFGSSPARAPSRRSHR
ncbi:MAG: hypothetical protein ACXW5U_11445 [Thermoanaerobaculia bacterium]